MTDPAKNPYTANSTAANGMFSAGQGLGTINAIARVGKVIGLALIGGVVVITGIAIQIPTVGKLTSLLESANAS